jgi:RNA polymerase sigma factor (sigma-70 family)
LAEHVVGDDNEEVPRNESKGSIEICLDRLKGGDPLAAQKLWDRYYRRLVGLARKKLGDSPRRMLDEDDVVQLAFSSFCLKAKAGCFPDLHDRDSLWALLALITARKAANQRMYEARLKRGRGRVPTNSAQDDGACDRELMQIISEQPSAEDALLFVAQMEQFMDSLEDPRDRLILLWKLEERTNPEIARYLDCSLSAIERKLRSIRRRLSREAPNG